MFLPNKIQQQPITISKITNHLRWKMGIWTPSLWCPIILFKEVYHCQKICSPKMSITSSPASSNNTKTINKYYKISKNNLINQIIQKEWLNYKRLSISHIILMMVIMIWLFYKIKINGWLINCRYNLVPHEGKKRLKTRKMYLGILVMHKISTHYIIKMPSILYIKNLPILKSFINGWGP